MKRQVSKERVGATLLVATLVTNPLTGQYVLQATDWLFQEMFTYGSWISMAAVIYMMGLLGVYYWKSERNTIPVKTAKTEAQIYTTT